MYVYCEKCGTRLSSTAKFCKNCGAPVSEVSEGQKTNPEGGTAGESIAGERTGKVSRQEKKLGDGAVDFLSSKLAGHKVETIRISMEDMLALLKEHYIDPADTEEDYKKLQKAVNGGIIGVTQLQSKDEKYSLSVKVAMQVAGRADLLHPGDSNWIRVVENDTGIVYQYSSLTWGKFKKTVKSMIEDAGRESSAAYEKPEVSEISEVAEASKARKISVTPEVSAQSETSEPSDTPEVPAQSGTSGIPETPEASARSETSKTPETPETPEASAQSETSEIPETPEASTQSEPPEDSDDTQRPAAQININNMRNPENDKTGKYSVLDIIAIKFDNILTIICAIACFAASIAFFRDGGFFSKLLGIVFLVVAVAGVVGGVKEFLSRTDTKVFTEKEIREKRRKLIVGILVIVVALVVIRNTGGGTYLRVKNISFDSLGTETIGDIVEDNIKSPKWSQEKIAKGAKRVFVEGYSPLYNEDLKITFYYEATDEGYEVTLQSIAFLDSGEVYGSSFEAGLVWATFYDD